MAQDKTVLVGLDGSEPAWRALAWAIKQTEGGGTLDLVAVVDLGQLDFYDGMYLTTEQIDRLQAKVKEDILSTAREKVPEGANASYTVLRGRVGLSLAERAEEVGATEIAIGRTGRGWVDRLTQGSVPRKLVSQSPVPVVVVP